MATNWQKWRFIPGCKLWQAVCLTMDIDPDSKDHGGIDDWWRNERCRGVPYGFNDEYAARLSVAMANVSTNGPIHPLALYAGVLNNPHADVSMSDVAAAAAAWGWVVPDAIKAPNNPPAVEAVTAPAQTPAPVVAASDGPAPLTTIIHSTKTRRDTLTPVIEQAQKQCTDPQDTAAVWAVLLVLAENKAAPLIGATEDGLQYLKNGTAASFNREALRKRLGR